MTRSPNVMNRFLQVSAGVMLAALTTVACDGDDGPAKEGELGVGNFIYRCVGDSDPFCSDGGVADTFPEAIAVGGRFNLDYNQDRDGALPNVIPGSDAVVMDGPSLVLTRAGFAVVLASQGFGDVIDLLHLTGRDVTRIATFTGDSQELITIELEVGERITLEGRPQDENRTTLAGSLDYEWGSDNEAVFEVASADQDESVEVEGVGPGTAQLLVTAGGFTQMIEVEVAGGSTTTDDGEDTGGPETDGSDDDGSSDGGSTDGGSSDGGSSDGDSSDGGSSEGGSDGSGSSSGGE